MPDASSLMTMQQIRHLYNLQKANVTANYDSTATYEIGDYCLYLGVLYRCISTISTAEDFDSSHWVSTNVDAELDRIETTSKSEAVAKADIVNNLTNPSTTTIPSSAAVANIIGANNAGFHNSIYRGKNLGTSVTAAQYAAISAVTFADMFVGDYWVINGVTWRIAGFDYWLNNGDTACTTHHVVIVPDSNLATCKMNDTNITTGAYIGSDYYTGNNGNTGKATAQSAINNAFGSAHILNHREYLKNAMTNGYESAGGWYDSTFELMTEQMVYGCKVFGNVVNGTNVPVSYTIDNAQLPLFRLDHSRICNRVSWWLRDPADSSGFACVGTYGDCNYYYASHSYGVRPAFGIRA